MGKMKSENGNISVLVYVHQQCALQQGTLFQVKLVEDCGCTGKLPLLNCIMGVSANQQRSDYACPETFKLTLTKLGVVLQAVFFGNWVADTTWWNSDVTFDVFT